MTNWGASQDDWNHFDLFLGLTNDLLPVVSNPNAELSPNSSLKDFSKAPSFYNASGKVVGFANWTSQLGLPSDIEKWSAIPDYGICVQTRSVRAIDIDISDPAEAAKISSFIAAHLETQSLPAPPVRWRANSGKRLMPLAIGGDLAKRVMLTAHGPIEFLATGQQFVACGTHPSGVRYEWAAAGGDVTPAGWLPPSIPELTLAQFEALWAAMSTAFAIEPPSEGSLRKKKTGADAPIDDDIILHLQKNNLILKRGREGQVFIQCPFKVSHTSDSGPTSTAYLPPGVRGYQRGHFDCRHAHCAGKTDEEFKQALGITGADDFSVVDGAGAADYALAPPGADGVSVTGTGVAGASSPALRPPYHTNGLGAVRATAHNVRLALQRPEVCGLNIAYDMFKGDIFLSPANEPGQWQLLQDTDYYRLRIALEHLNFLGISKEIVRDAVHYVANENRFDSAILWINGLKWDGVPRVKKFMHTYLKCDDNEYADAVSLYTWTALAGRALVPGCQVDMVPIWEGAQGAGKSRAAEALVPDPMFFTEIGFHEKESDIVRKIKGVLVAEISELRGLHTRELEVIKAFVTRRHEKWVPKYIENTTTYPRRVLFIGTTNQSELLADETGNRRWLPIATGVAGTINVLSIVEDRNQLWAEARELFVEHGVMWQDAMHLGVGEHEKYMVTDMWEEPIRDWLYGTEDVGGETSLSNPVLPAEWSFIAIQDIFRIALKIDVDKRDGRQGTRIKKIMSKLGFEPYRKEHCRGYRKKK